LPIPASGPSGDCRRSPNRCTAFDPAPEFRQPILPSLRGAIRNSTLRNHRPAAFWSQICRLEDWPCIRIN